MGIQEVIHSNDTTTASTAGGNVTAALNATTTSTTTTKQKLPDVYNLQKIRASLPKQVFEKSFFLSTAYLFKDLLLWGLTIYLYQQLQQTSWYVNSATTLMKIAFCLVYWNVAGFWMWCLFVVGKLLIVIICLFVCLLTCCC